jgi:hypothetical protein
MLDERHDSLRRQPRLVLGIALVLVSIPFLLGLYGPMEIEVALWAAVMLAVGSALTAVAIGSTSPQPRWVILVDAASVLLFIPATLILNVVIGERWSVIAAAALLMLVLAATVLVGRRHLPVRAVAVLVAILALLVAAAQVPAIWSWFHYGRLSDTPDPTPFSAHWVYAFPHMLLVALALWTVGRELIVLRSSSGQTQPSLNVGQPG